MSTGDAGLPRFERLRAIFDAARELPTGERAHLLDARCGADTELREEVEALLAQLDGGGHRGLSETAIDAARGVLESLVAEGMASAGPAPGWTPERIGPYRILRHVAEGGMGVVYEAEQDSPRRRIALKVVHPLFVTPTRLKRFRQEAELLGRLRHPGIAQIHEAGSYDLGHGSQPYFAMEFVEGVDLRAHVAAAALPVAARLALVAEVCDAVQHAHEMGVIHRDLKPENIMVDARGQPKVLDFGVAHASEGSTAMSTLVTQEGDLLGTIAYMAPEQFEGQPDVITPRADVYALGAIAFELLAGRLPHDVVGLPLAAAMEIVREKEPPRLGELRPELRGDVETIVGKALEKEPGRRYASAASFAADLRAHLEHRPIAARPPSQIYRAVKFTRRNKALVGGTVATLVAVTAGLIASLLFAFRADESAARAREGERAAVAGVLQATQDLLERGDRSRAAITYRKVVGERTWETDLLERALPTMLPERYGLEPPMWVGNDRLAVGIEDGGVLIEVGTWREVQRFLDGHRLIFSSYWSPSFLSGPPWETVLFDFDTGRVRSRVKHADPQAKWPAMGVIVEADGHFHTCRYDPDTATWTTLLDGVEVARLGSETTRDFFPYVSPDGRRVVALHSRAGILYVHDFHEGSLLGRLDGLLLTSCPYVFFPPGDQEFLAFDDSYELLAVDIDTAEPLREVGINAGSGCRGGSLSASGTLFAQDVEDGLVQVFDLTTNQIAYQEQLELSAGRSLRVEFSPDASRLLVMGDDLACCVLDLDTPLVSPEVLGTADDPRATTHAGHEGYVQDFAISPDGRMIASLSPSDPLLRVWDAATGVTLTTVPKPVATSGNWTYNHDRGYLIAFAPDGRRLIATVRQGLERPQLLVHDLVSGRSRLEQLAPRLSSLSHLPWLDRFLEVLGAATPMRLGRKAFLAADGTAWAVQVSNDHQVPEGSRWSAFVDNNEDQGLSPSHDGSRIAVAAQRTVRVYDRRTARELKAFPGQSRCVDWSPDGRLIAAGDPDGRIRLIDAELMTELYSFRAHDDLVFAVAWTPDGSRLVSASADKTLRVWDPRRRAIREADRSAYLARLAPLRELGDEELRGRLDAAESVEDRFAALRVVLERRTASGDGADPSD